MPSTSNEPNEDDDLEVKSQTENDEQTTNNSNEQSEEPQDLQSEAEKLSLNEETKLQKMKEAQRHSDDFRLIVDNLENGMLPTDDNTARLIVNEACQYELLNGVLYHMYQRRTKGKI